MKILLIGSGGREHALAHALKKSPNVEKIFAAPGNPGIFTLAEETNVDVSDHAQVVKFCKHKNVDLVVVGPENPLADGIADVLRGHGINVFGPSKAGAQLEASKAFAKEFMRRRDIPTAKHRTFTAKEKQLALDYADKADFPLVLKADGLAAGKGVLIVHSKDQAHSALNDMFGGMFGEASKTVVIEEFLDGEEASVLAVTDGSDYVTLAPSQDHKRALDGDKGKNTGGMGAYAPAPVVTDEILQKVKTKIIEPTLDGMKEQGDTFSGCLYVGLMIVANEPYVVEYNVRFGDPETEAVLPLFSGDFAELLLSAAKGKIDRSAVENVQNGAACTVILASEGYPGGYDKGFPIEGTGEAEDMGAIVYHCGTGRMENRLITAGGRVLAVTGVTDNLKTSIEKAYIAASKIHFENKFNRTDIGSRALSRF